MMSWNNASQQNIRPSHSGVFILLLLKSFLMTRAFSTGVKHSHKNNKISKTTKLQQYSKFVTLGNNKVLTGGCFKPSTTIPIYSWFSSLTGTIRNKHKLLLSPLCQGFDVVTLSHDKNWIIYSFWAQQHYSSPLLLPTEACYSLGWLHFKDTHTQPIISYLHKILQGNYYFYIQYKQGLAQAHATLKTIVHDRSWAKALQRKALCLQWHGAYQKSVFALWFQHILITGVIYLPCSLHVREVILL